MLSVKNLSVKYGSGNSMPEVRDISFTVGQGMTLGIVGESGAGKTTVAMAVAGLLEESATITGRVIFNDIDLLALDEKAMCGVRGSGIGMIFQDPRASLDPSMSVLDQVAEPLRLHLGLNQIEGRKQALQLLKDVSINQDILSVAPYAHMLSGGLCQRVMIATALACHPQVLIADEPTSSLDLTLQSQIIGLIKQRQKATGLGVMFITHDLALITKIADEILVMYQGRAVERGRVENIISNPDHPYTAELVSILEDSGLSRGGGNAAA